MNWVSRKIHLYNVTMDIMVLILLWFICFNGSRFASDVFESHLKARIMPGGNYGMGVGMPST
uniref:Uncharacterized protein n=1 Tax=Oryza meridionalis TaxID=40149 RepID=A0A0E0EAQ4_9ORYZ